MKKKKILFHSNHSRAYTGFGKNAKNILKYLTKTGNYELVELANGLKMSDPVLKTLPWKALGTLPDSDEELQLLNQDPDKARAAGYGAAMIDRIIEQEKPDIYIGAEDIWAFNDYYDKYWWNKINCMIWTTLDSLPILPAAILAAPKIKNYYVWASFAEKALRKLNFKQVQTLRGSLDITNFSRLDEDGRQSLREHSQLPRDSFIIGFVFRNQLRKSVPNLLDGFKLFLERNPHSNAKLLLHTHWSEGWDIPRFLAEKQINPALILTTYYCHHCRQYEVKPFSGQEQNCRFCGAERSQNTTNVSQGVTETQLNEIYNLMDVYCHPFTSGGQEIPVQEAKLTELITLVTNYSCGEDNCGPESGGFPLEWSEYREPGTQFIKASTYPSSIAKQLTKVYKMNPAKKREKELKARKFVIENFGIEAIGSQLEAILDKMPLIENFDFKKPIADPHYPMPHIKDDAEWVSDLYKNILKRENVDHSDPGHQHWMERLRQDLKREAVYNYFINCARKDAAEKELDLLSLLDDEGKNQRILVVAQAGPREVLYCLSLLPSLKAQYPTHNIYFATTPAFELLLDNNDLIHKYLPFNESMHNALYLEGAGPHEGFFDIALIPEKNINLSSQAHHNGSFNSSLAYAST